MTIRDEWFRLLDFVGVRKRDYVLIFRKANWLAGQAVLRDIGLFCRAQQTCFHPDPRMHALLEGRREVWLRIQAHLNLSEAQLAELFSGRTLKNEDDTNA